MNFDYNPFGSTRDAVDFLGKMAQIRNADEARKIRELMEQMARGKQPDPREQCFIESQALKERYKCPVCDATGNADRCNTCNPLSPTAQQKQGLHKPGYVRESGLPYRLKGQLSPAEETCRECRGTGGIGNMKCYSCGGRGSKPSRTAGDVIYKCPDCNGQGYVKGTPNPYSSYSNRCKCHRSTRNELINGIDQDRWSEYITALHAKGITNGSRYFQAFTLSRFLFCRLRRATRDLQSWVNTRESTAFFFE